MDSCNLRLKALTLSSKYRIFNVNFFIVNSLIASLVFRVWRYVIGALDMICGKTVDFWDLTGSDDCIECGDETALGIWGRK